MTYDEWRDEYSPHGMMNEAMARAAWNASRKNTVQTIAATLRRGGADLPCNDNMNAVEKGLSIALLIVEDADK